MSETISESRTEFYTDYFASWSCRVCGKVIDGAAINFAYRTPDAFVFAHDEADALSGCGDLWRADCLLERHPEMLPLFHLPYNVAAERANTGWKLRQIPVFDRVNQGSAVALRTVEAVKNAERTTYYALTFRSAISEKVFMAGARFAPIWRSAAAAKADRNKSFLERLLFRVREFSLDDFVKRALEDDHNYIAINMDEDTWEVLIINDELNIGENTLRL